MVLGPTEWSVYTTVLLAEVTVIVNVAALPASAGLLAVMVGVTTSLCSVIE